ncbi:uncharacterized protein [Zea mays]|jgi:hypothetical protein|uniref:Uncharacterized protein n=1 Tax=Zea mays TaxID=4577 RepID=A0A1D6FAJ8_MAIZE|nr:uncharacterized protein LOC103648304 [Zea mays]ONM28096.1 hypothetical protein ZEAMMB73_Zm00001d007977 [Zea mays]|eukprot:XP_020404347.1 uncharacterized protein LOC103648304 [Zea mays]
MSRGAGGGGGGKLGQHVSWLWRGPRRALCAARDLYVRSLTGCAGHLPGDAAFGYPTFAAAPSFGSFASSSSSRRASDADQDLRELVRAASQRRAAELERQRHPAAVPRSRSVAAAAMARIDEDGPCDFASSAAAVFPRSRSFAPGAGRVVGVAGRRGSVATLAA